MDIRTVEGFSMKDAIQKVKKQYGAEAVILSTSEKPVDSNGTRVTEVRVALPEVRMQGASKEPGPSASGSGSLIQERLDAMDRRIAWASDQLASKEQLARVESGVRELKLLINSHIKTLSLEQGVQVPQHLSPVDQQLTLMGTDPVYKKEVLSYLEGLPVFAPGKSGAHKSPAEYYRSHAIRYMYRKISVYPAIVPSTGHTGVHMFVGGSGVGKTCTVAKLASHIQSAYKRNVLLISYDYGSHNPNDPLGVFAKILGLRHANIEDAAQLEDVVLKHRNHELVFLDTSGGLPANQQTRALLKLKECSFPVDTHLVMSLTEHSGQMELAVQKFSVLGLQSLAFTRLDACSSFGEIFNQPCRWSVPVSYFTTGPKIPDDIEPASRERVLERLFGL